MNQRGVLFVGTNNAYLKEAANAAETVRNHNPQIPIAIASHTNDIPDIFDRVITLSNPDDGYVDKIAAMKRSPFSRTLYLDSDVYICDAEIIEELFRLLNQFDIAASIDDGRRYNLVHDDNLCNSPPLDVNAPDCLPMLNSGVLPFGDTAGVSHLLQTWNRVNQRHSREGKNTDDQPALREAIYRTDVSVAPLPPECNCRLPYPQRLVGDVRILHGRASNLKQIEEILNGPNADWWRTYVPVYTGPKGLPMGHRTTIKPLLNPGSIQIWATKLLLRVKQQL